MANITKTFPLALLGAFAMPSCEKENRNIEKVAPFTDVIITDIFESKVSRPINNDTLQLFVRILFLDFLAGKNSDNLSAYSRDRVFRIIDSSSSSEDIRLMLIKQIGDIQRIQKVNAVFYNTDGKVAFCVIGDSDLITSSYENKNAKVKLDELVHQFLDHLIVLKRTLKNDSERDRSWGQR